ncbi:MAG: FAD-dependent oxidoreductase [Spirochaetia bacterium]|nr:FAD-dependent oxidoreductase [Spirochaetia bacterium]
MNPTTVKDMLTVVESCMGDAPPYCHTACPMHTDVKGYVNLIADGKHKEAIQTIREKLFLPKTLGRVCAHPCEEQCKRNEVGNAMSIAALKRFVADNYDDENDWDLTCEAERPEKIAVIGAGPAGAQAALDLRRNGYQVTIYEKHPVVGGMLYVGIPSYRLPREIINAEYSLLNRLGVRFELSTEVGKDIPFDDLVEQYDGVVIAIGAHKGFKLPVKGAELPGAVQAVDFLREVSLTGKYEGFGKRVTIIGGGNVALDSARTAIRLGAEKVHLVCLERDIKEMFAHDWEVEEAVEEGVILHNSWGTDTIEGNGKVERINLKKCIQVFDPKGRFNPAYDEQNKDTIETDMVIFAIGQGVDSEFATSVEVGRGGRFVVDAKTLQTTNRKVFACGDGTGISLMAVEAMSEGRIAAESLHRYLNGRDMRSNRDHERAYRTSLETTIPADDTNPVRVETRKMDIATRKQTFSEVDLGFSEEEALNEASRCLKCECRLCVKECLMLQEYSPDSPKTYFKEVLINGKLDAITPFSCNMCGTCTLVCPRDFRLQEIFMNMRKELVAANHGKSPMKGHKAIEMHQLLGFSRIFNTTQAAKTSGSNGKEKSAGGSK